MPHLKRQKRIKQNQFIERVETEYLRHPQVRFARTGGLTDDEAPNRIVIRGVGKEISNAPATSKSSASKKNNQSAPCLRRAVCRYFGAAASVLALRVAMAI
jgi:hypothetical protein